MAGTSIQPGEVCTAGHASLGALTLLLSAHVSAVDEVLVTLFNPMPSEVDVGNGTLRVAVSSFAEGV